MKVVAVEEEIEVGEEQKQDLEIREWERGREDQAWKRGDEDQGGRKEGGGEKEQRENKDGNEDLEERKRDCMQSMLKLRLYVFKHIFTTVSIIPYQSTHSSWKIDPPLLIYSPAQEGCQEGG